MNTPKRTVLHVEMTPVQLATLKQQAVSLGFSSAQAYVRHYMSRELEPHSNRELKLNEACKIALRYCELTLARKQPLPSTAHQALNAISLQLKRRSFLLMYRSSMN